jgi:hypothetical protein
MKKQEVIVKVQESLGSLFTKDDVVNTINLISEEPKVVKEQKEDFIAILKLIKDKIKNTIDKFDFDDSDNIELDNVEFEVRYGNQIEFDSFSVDARTLKSNLLDDIINAFEELEQEHETRMEIIDEENDIVQLERGEVIGNVIID